MLDTSQQGRTASFYQGKGDGSLNRAHTLQQEVVPDFAPHSVLHQLVRSPNGMSDIDAPRRLAGGGFLPTHNGMSEQTYDVARYLQSKNVNFSS